MFYILVIHIDNAQVIFVLTEVCQPGGAAINFSKIDRNQDLTKQRKSQTQSRSQTEAILKVKKFTVLKWCI